jgi:hypothetical protein
MSDSRRTEAPPMLPPSGAQVTESDDRRCEGSGISLLDGPDGLVSQLSARIIERAMGAEMDELLGYENGDPARHGTREFPNVHYGKRRSMPSTPPTASAGRPLWVIL